MNQHVETSANRQGAVLLLADLLLNLPCDRCGAVLQQVVSFRPSRTLDESMDVGPLAQDRLAFSVTPEEKNDFEEWLELFVLPRMQQSGGTQRAKTSSDKTPRRRKTSKKQGSS